MFEAKIFLAGPSRMANSEINTHWPFWQPHNYPKTHATPANVYIADAGLESFLKWFDALPEPDADRVHNIVWCGDGDSLGKHGIEILKNTAARFEGRWREHFYAADKDFSDCAAMMSLLEYDLRHAQEPARQMWLTVHGAWGGRYDHELVNLFEISAMLARIPCVGAVVLGPERVLTTAPIDLRLPFEHSFSLLSAFADQQLRVKVTGARYSGELLLRQPSHGLSNQCLAELVVVEPMTPSVPVFGIVS
ncbi:MAG: hypothetical protein RI953_2712 [Pseudomonadota bacterium]|jgi:thiamine pyrophosphokinase